MSYDEPQHVIINNTKYNKTSNQFPLKAHILLSTGTPGENGDGWRKIYEARWTLPFGAESRHRCCHARLQAQDFRALWGPWALENTGGCTAGENSSPCCNGKMKVYYFFFTWENQLTSLLYCHFIDVRGKYFNNIIFLKISGSLFHYNGVSLLNSWAIITSLSSCDSFRCKGMVIYWRSSRNEAIHKIRFLLHQHEGFMQMSDLTVNCLWKFGSKAILDMTMGDRCGLLSWG